MAYQPYSIAKHTILPLLYTVIHPNSFSYLLKDPATSSLILLSSSVHRQQLKKHISNIQNQFNCKLTHSFANNNSEIEESPLFDEQVINPKKQGDLKPFLIGELSICYIGASGYKPDYNLLAATHISSTSTKFAVLFPGKMLSVCSIDLQSQAKANQYCETINKLKYFPNETLLFPESKATIEDLQFAQALQKNTYLGEKIQRFQTLGRQIQNCLIPTSILEQKMMNPFLNPQKYASLLKTNDKNTCFDILRKMRLQWKK